MALEPLPTIATTSYIIHCQTSSPAATAYRSFLTRTTMKSSLAFDIITLALVAPMLTGKALRTLCFVVLWALPDTRTTRRCSCSSRTVQKATVGGRTDHLLGWQRVCESVICL